MTAKREKSEHKYGFTLIELMVVLGAFALLATLSMPIYHTVQKNIALEDDSQVLVNNLRLAQNLSFMSQDGTNHGVYFDSGGYILYDGKNYAAATDERKFTLSPGVSVISGVGSDVNFTRLDGTAAPATIKIGTNASDVKTIAIDANGRVDLD